MAVIPPRVVGTPTAGESNHVVQTSLTIPRPSGAQNGDILVAALRSGSSVQSSDFALAGWTRKGPAFTPNSAGVRVTSVQTHYVSDILSEPANYVFALAGNTFARHAGLMFIVRPGIGAIPWGSEPAYGQTAGGSSGPPAYANSFTITPGSLVVYSAGDELTSGAALGVTIPTDATLVGIHGSFTDQANTSTSRSVIAAATQLPSGTTAAGSANGFTWPSMSSAIVHAFSIPGTEADVVIPPNTPIGKPIKLHDGSPARLSYLDSGSVRKAPGILNLWLPGFPTVDNLLANINRHPTFAHRGGSNVYPEFSEYAYDRCVRRGYGVLEMSVGWSSDVIPFGLADSTLDRMTGIAGAGDPALLTWEYIKTTYRNRLNPVAAGVYQPMFSLEQFLAKYSKTHVLLVDPKFGIGESWRIKVMLDLCDAYGGPEKIIIKFDSPTNDPTIQVPSRARGYKTMNYWGNDLASLDLQHTQWDLLGFDYTASQESWDVVNSYGQPTWAAALPDNAAVASTIAKGAGFLMCRNPISIPPVSVWNA